MKETNTRYKGSLAVLKVMSALSDIGGIFSLPWGDNGRYDLIWDNGTPQRIQVKTGRLRNGCITFNAHSSYQYYKKVRIRKGYKGEIEYFGVFCSDTGLCYLVPVEDVTEGMPLLRVDPPKNGQVRRIRWAKEYEIRACGLTAKAPGLHPGD